MFGRRREKVDITSTDPQFMVRYVGKIETFTASGQGCTKDAVQKIWDNASEEKRLKKASLLITPAGIIMTSHDDKNVVYKFDIKCISYCSAEQGVHVRTFAWVYKDSKKLECHAVQASTKEKAQAMAVLLSRAFQIAYKDWKGHKEKLARQKNANKGWQPASKRGESDAPQPARPMNESAGGTDTGEDGECFSENGVIMDADRETEWSENATVRTHMQGENVSFEQLED